MKLALIPAALIALSAPLAAAPLSPEAGPFKAEGSFTDQDGHIGQWHAEGTLQGGRFAGSLVLELLGVTRSVTLAADRAQLRKGQCVLRGTNGRNWVQLRGQCDDAAIGPGGVTGAFDGHRLGGSFRGTLTAGPVAAPAPPTPPPRRR